MQQGYGGPVLPVQPAGDVPGVGGQRQQDHLRHGGTPRQLEDRTKRHQHRMDQSHFIIIFIMVTLEAIKLI